MQKNIDANVSTTPERTEAMHTRLKDRRLKLAFNSSTWWVSKLIVCSLFVVLASTVPVINPRIKQQPKKYQSKAETFRHTFRDKMSQPPSAFCSTLLAIYDFNEEFWPERQTKDV
jgi:hypothetical protein